MSPVGAGIFATISSNTSSILRPVFAEIRGASNASMPITSSISCAISSGLAEGRSILLITGKTSTGFEFQLEDEALDDYELLENLKKVDDGDTNVLIIVVDQLLGEEQKNRLKDHVRTEKGRVSAKRLLEEVSEIFNSCNAGKN